MAASTEIKFYVHTNNNAPQLQNAYGSMINVLDACLVNGINIGTISSLTASGKTVTALFSSAHNLMQYQVVKIAGANQSEFNGEHRILTIPNSTTATFELAVVPSVATATGTINCSLPPLGWEKPFSSSNPGAGGKAAYRSTNLLLSSRPFLRVVDELDAAYTATFTKYAKVGLVEDMASIDTMLGVQAPFDAANPDKNWIGTGSGESALNGWARWYYSRMYDEQSTPAYSDVYTPQDGNRKYILVGDTDHFYIVPCIALTNFGYLYGFGQFKTLLAADACSNFLASTLVYNTATGLTYPAQYNALGNNTATTLLLQRNTKQDGPATASCVSLGSSALFASGTDLFGSASTVGIMTSAQVYIKESGGNNLRGELKNIKWLFQGMPYIDKTIVTTSASAYIALNINNRLDTNTSGQVLLKIKGV